MLEEFEDVVGDWYFHHQDQPLQRFLCEGHVLPATETGQFQGWTPPLPGHSFPYPRSQRLSRSLSPTLACLQETWTGKEITDEQEKVEGEEEAEAEAEMTKAAVNPTHDPEDL